MSFLVQCKLVYNFYIFVTICFISHHILGGDDYNATEVIQVQFPANQNIVDFSIHIIDNDIAECQKQFKLLLEVPENASDMGVVTKEYFTAVVHITDDWDGTKLHTCNYVHDVQMYALCDIVIL